MFIMKVKLIKIEVRDWGLKQDVGKKREQYAVHSQDNRTCFLQSVAHKYVELILKVAVI